jgi:hypothetical protein
MFRPARCSLFRLTRIARVNGIDSKRSRAGLARKIRIPKGEASGESFLGKTRTEVIAQMHSANWLSGK